MGSTRDLSPGFKDLADTLIEAARDLDPQFVITSSKRSYLDQLRLYARYQREKLAGHHPLPAAVPGTSLHELGYAVDIARPGVDPREDELLAALGEWWESAGMRWGGRFNDPVHFEPSRDVIGAVEGKKGAEAIVVGWADIDSALIANAASALGLDDD
jgi:D-alanyl-D-alanine carboxypeptidase